MDDQTRANGHGGETLEEANRTIARLSGELERLKQRVANERFAEELSRALTRAAVAGRIGSPVTHSRLLEMIVETAARVIGARAASLFLIDYGSQQLTFEVALGEKAEEVKKFTVPLGHGIAGLVAVSGQPMAVSDASHDPRQAADIAGRIGYSPGTILCVPLYYDDTVIGVLELLDKEGAPSFTADDMAILGLFANQAAVAIEQSRTHRNLVGLIGEVLGSLGGDGNSRDAELKEQINAFAASIEESPTYQQAVELAQVVQQIAWTGGEELRFCRTVLNAFAEYLRARPASGFSLEGGSF